MQAIVRGAQRALVGPPLRCERHRPEQSTLYRLVQQYAAGFIAQASTGAEMPRFVKDEFDAFLGARRAVDLHCLVLDGVYRGGGDGVPAFVEVAEPTGDKLHALLQAVITRLTKMLTRRGVLVEDMGRIHLTEPDEDSEEARTLRALRAAAVAYRIAFGPCAQQRVLTLRGEMPRKVETVQARPR